MRNSLAHDLFTYHIIVSTICQNCISNTAETAQHYLLECNKYTDQRTILHDKLWPIIGEYQITNDLLLFGSEELPQ
jgi:hypothetical protein